MVYPLLIFDTDQSRLSSEARQILANNVNWLKANAVDIEIEGHCDERGSTEYNIALGHRRAQAVKDYLVNLGVDGSRLKTTSLGKEKPIAFGSSPSDLARNRRANFVPQQ